PQEAGLHSDADGRGCCAGVPADGAPRAAHGGVLAGVAGRLQGRRGGDDQEVEAHLRAGGLPVRPLPVPQGGAGAGGRRAHPVRAHAAGQGHAERAVAELPRLLLRLDLPRQRAPDGGGRRRVRDAGREVPRLRHWLFLAEHPPGPHDRHPALREHDQRPRVPAAADEGRDPRRARYCGEVLRQLAQERVQAAALPGA
ncbi:putative pyruvate/indole-pyruvate carboxylase, partial [Leptomonas seymouri]